MDEAEGACGPKNEKPPSKEACQIRPCYGNWRTGDWSKVSCMPLRGLMARASAS